VRALFTKRVHVLRDYRRRVVRPVIRELIKQDSACVLARCSQQLLVRHPKLLDEQARQQLPGLLNGYEFLPVMVNWLDDRYRSTVLQLRGTAHNRDGRHRGPKINYFDTTRRRYIALPNIVGHGG
jgi:hypothetical protein